MKKLVAVIALTFMLFLVCANAKSKKKYLALGDSITAGYRLDNPEEDSYASLFSKEYDLELTNEAVSGDKSGALLEKLSNYNIDDYDVITVCIGANDVLRDFVEKFEELSPLELLNFINTLDTNDEFNKKIDDNLVELDHNLEAIMNILKKSHAQIYMMNIYNPYKNNLFPALEGIADKYMNKLNIIIEKYAKTVNFIDLYTEFKNNDDKIINSQKLTTIYDPHPNKDGHIFIAKVLGESYYNNNKPEKVNFIPIIVFGILTIVLETVEVIYTFKKFAVKPIIKDDENPKKEEEIKENDKSSRFIRS